MPFFLPRWRREGKKARQTTDEYRVRVRLALQTALVGQITSSLRLISAEIEPNFVRVVVYYDRELADDDRSDLAEEVALCLGLALGDPPAGPTIECHYVRCDEPQLVPVRGEIVFARKGVRTC